MKDKDERPAVSAVWREALAIIRRYPFATIVPALVCAASANAPYYFLLGSGFAWEQILTFVTAAFAYYLYVAYAEEVVAESERGADSILLISFPRPAYSVSARTTGNEKLVAPRRATAPP